MLLKARNLTHKFEYELFLDINLELKKAQSISIRGISGCGKSTMLHILSTLLKPDSGEVFYNEKSIYQIDENERLNIRRYDFGIIFQAHYLFKGFLAKENIDLARVLVGNTSKDEKMLEKLGINHILNQKIGSLSGGQQQRVSIARVLAKKPKIIFADEPTGNLDEKTANNVMQILFDYIKEQNAGLILVTHDENLANICDERYQIQDKNLIRV